MVVVRSIQLAYWNPFPTTPERTRRYCAQFREYPILRPVGPGRLALTRGIPKPTATVAQLSRVAKTTTLNDDETLDFVRTPVLCTREYQEERSLAGGRDAAEAEEKKLLEWAASPTDQVQKTVDMEPHRRGQCRRRSVQLAASTADIGSLGSEYAAVEKVLGKRIRKRGRGRTTEYLVQFKGSSDKLSMWTAA
ncbi:hypothetical protein MHUMG1_08669 [Metarhizium humberi]|uniref:Chromo domain-containing protein n=1 Tax=Metarhizium humberi TaxID=2596975 RepID=A0A9P8M379_9HYPO|nr:hypothetical protein MHUMG1_08669 [Metarhizium humberi]